MDSKKIFEQKLYLENLQLKNSCLEEVIKQREEQIENHNSKLSALRLEIFQARDNYCDQVFMNVRKYLDNAEEEPRKLKEIEGEIDNLKKEILEIEKNVDEHRGIIFKLSKEEKELKENDVNAELKEKIIHVEGEIEKLNKILEISKQVHKKERIIKPSKGSFVFKITSKNKK